MDVLKLIYEAIDEVNLESEEKNQKSENSLRRNICHAKGNRKNQH